MNLEPDIDSGRRREADRARAAQPRVERDEVHARRWSHRSLVRVRRAARSSSTCATPASASRPRNRTSCSRGSSRAKGCAAPGDARRGPRALHRQADRRRSRRQCRRGVGARGAGARSRCGCPARPKSPRTAEGESNESHIHRRRRSRRARVGRVQARAAGHEVLSAANGQDALRLVPAARPGLDLLLLDVMMPGFSGFDVLARAARRRSDEAVADHHAHGQGAGRPTSSAASRSAPNDYVLKPFSPRELMNRIVAQLVPVGLAR